MFGWCLDCMEEQGCARVKVARRGRRLRRRRRRLRPRRVRVRTVPERRARGLALVAVALGLWGVSIAALGTWKALHAGRFAPTPFAAGAPAVLVVGGASLSAAGLVLAGVALARAKWFWACLEWVLFACAVLVLMFGVVRYDPRRAPWMVALAGFAVSVSALIHQRRRFDVRPTDRHGPDTPDGFAADDDRGDVF